LARPLYGFSRASPIATQLVDNSQIEMRERIERKASAKAREFEKWRRQNEGDNSAPRMLKNRPAIVPLKTEV
jgi:hypothetical protein